MGHGKLVDLLGENMTLDELYKQYGELSIQAEILQAKINVVKQKIADELNKQTQSEEKEDGK